MSVVFIALIWNAFSFQVQLQETREASSDNRVWSVTQIEVDHQNLILALARLRLQHDAQAPVDKQEAIDRLSRTFDVFYSRIDVVCTALDREGTPAGLKDQVRAIDSARQDLAEQFDIMDFTRPQALSDFEGEVVELTPQIRQIVLGGLAHFVAEAKASRREENRLSTRFLTTSAIMVVIMAAAMVFAMRLHRELKLQIERMEVAHDNARIVYEASMMGVIMTKADGEITQFNAAAAQMFGYKQQDVIGRNVADVLIPDHMLAAHEAGMRNYLKTGVARIVNQGAKRIPARHADGGEFPVELSLRRDTDITGEHILIAFVQDVSKQTAHENELLQARDSARQNATAKTIFLATMSHEMRTPLHGLLASLDLIDIEAVDKPTASLLSTARDCGLRSLVQINEVLELTRLDETKEEPEVFSPAQTVSGIVKELEALARDNGNQLTLDVTGAPADRLWEGQPKAFSRVIYNLVGNALKFTSNGRVTVAMAFNEDSQGACRLHVSVQDTGIGIKPEDQPHVFEMFQIAGEAPKGNRNARYKSTGLGLPIAQIAVNKMGGEISLESELGHGSRFFFDIPVTRTDQTLPPVPSAADLPLNQHFDFNTLLVDDNAVNLELSSKMIERLGAKVTQAVTGTEAVEKARTDKFDVIFMDMNLPELSGRAAAAQIKSAGASKNAAIIALTADVTTKHDAAITKHGINDVLHKPAFIADFRKVFETLEQQYSPNTAAAAAPDCEDDNRVDIKELVDLLGPERCRALLDATLRDIESALEAIRTPTAETANIVHHAIGSTAVMGLADLSKELQQAETLADEGNFGAVRLSFDRIEVTAQEGCSALSETVVRCGL